MRETGLYLTVATPSRVLVDGVPIVSLRAVDESGSFGIRTGHAEFVTLLDASVVHWHTADDVEHFCAVDGGVLTVSSGNRVAVACREAILGDSLTDLEDDVRNARASRLDAERNARVELMKLHAQAIRQLLRYLNPGKGSGEAALPELPGSKR